MIESHKVTSIIIDDPGVSITKSFDGDMVFRDKFIPGVKLKDLLGNISGAPFIFDPAIIVLVEPIDYTYLISEELYSVEVPTGFMFSGTQKSGIIIEIYDINYVKIGVDEVKSKDNSVYLKLSEAESIYVVMKRIV